jgi:putative ATP-binding cassette transporter
MAARKSFLRDVWRLIKPYWSSEERLSAWILLISVVGLTLGMVYMSVQFNEWYNVFYNAIQEKNVDVFWTQILKFCVLAAIYIALAVYAFYLNQMLQIRWRRWMTDKYLKEWLAERAYYRMQLKGNPADNPDQRIAEDLKLFVDTTLELSLGLLHSVVTLVSFVAILWALSGPITLPVAGREFVIPGYMVWAAVIYAIVGTWLTHKIGKPLIGLNFDQQRYEADFRFGLIRFRENGESVALYAGEQDELKGFRSRFGNVVQNWWRIMNRQKILITFTVGYNQIANVFPFIVAGPRYFAGAIQLGGLMQISNSFDKVQGALSWFIGAYTTFAGWKATCDRLIGFRETIDRAHAEAREQSGFELERGNADELAVRDVALALPDGQPLVSPSSFTVRPGERVLIRGASGSGKSTLFRAIAGIWPYVKGKVRLPEARDVLFLPQRPYLPIGSIRDIVAYPSQEKFSDDQLRQALSDVGLGGLAGRLDEQQHWALQLSPGEQQRIAFARALLQRPGWLFLDEATSALDEEAETELYGLLKSRLPQTTVLSIGHRPTLAALHERRLELKDTGIGTRTLVPA